MTEQDIEKIVEDKDSEKQNWSTKVAKELFADYVKEKKLREPEEKKELAQTVKTFHVEARKKGFVKCRFGFCDIQNSQGLSKGYQPQPTSTLIILDITKPSPNNCLMLILEKAIHGKLGPKDDLGPVDTPNINRVKIISLFCTAHRPVSILLLLQVWR